MMKLLRSDQVDFSLKISLLKKAAMCALLLLTTNATAARATQFVYTVCRDGLVVVADRLAVNESSGAKRMVKKIENADAWTIAASVGVPIFERHNRIVFNANDVACTWFKHAPSASVLGRAEELSQQLARTYESARINADRRSGIIFDTCIFHLNQQNTIFEVIHCRLLQNGQKVLTATQRRAFAISGEFHVNQFGMIDDEKDPPLQVNQVPWPKALNFARASFERTRKKYPGVLSAEIRAGRGISGR